MSYRIKPSYPRLNRSHSLSRGLLLHAPIFEASSTRVTDISGFRRHGTTTFSKWNAGAYGPVLSHLEPSYRTLFGDSSFLPTAACTVVMGYRKRDTTNRASAAFGVDATDAKRLQVHLPYSDGVVYWDFGGSASGSSRLSVSGLTFGNDLWAFTTGLRGMEIWQNGIRRANNAASPTRTASTEQWGLGQAVATNSDRADYWYLSVYDRQLGTDEIASLQSDPWQIYGATRPAFLSFRSFSPAWASKVNNLIGAGF